MLWALYSLIRAPMYHGVSIYMTLSKPQYLLKTHLQVPSYWGSGFNIRNWGRGCSTSIQYIAHCFIHFIHFLFAEFSIFYGCIKCLGLNYIFNIFCLNLESSQLNFQQVMLYFFNSHSIGLQKCVLLGVGEVWISFFFFFLPPPPDPIGSIVSDWERLLQGS